MVDHYMFSKGTRYMTRGIKEKIPLAIQLTLWSYIDDIVNSDIQTDYLQIFKFSVEDDACKLIHSQEKDNYHKVYKYSLHENLVGLDAVKVYVIDDVSHSTMLLANEY